MKRIEMTGKKVGKLLVTNKSEKRFQRMFWVCICDCGKEKIVDGIKLRNGNTKSCGCFREKHGHSHGHNGSRTYKSWIAMKSRCLDVNHPAYCLYGGRGIRICEDWILDFNNFLSDMGIRPLGKTLDRINNNLGYYKENCRWATIIEQSNNRTTNIFINFNNQSKTISMWARELGVNTSTIRERIKNGWSVEESLSIPVSKYRKTTTTNHGQATPAEGSHD